MSYEQAAGLFITYPTSYEGLVGRGEVKKGDWVLVHAGAGGVGLAAVQIAKGTLGRGTSGCVSGVQLRLTSLFLSLSTIFSPPKTTRTPIQPDLGAITHSPGM